MKVTAIVIDDVIFDIKSCFYRGLFFCLSLYDCLCVYLDSLYNLVDYTIINHTYHDLHSFYSLKLPYIILTGISISKEC